MLNKVAFA